MNPKQNILFYSRTCEHSQKLFRLLQSENLLDYFNLYCVDDRLDKIPSQIKMVPTMIVNNVNKPLEGQETFEWVQKMKFLRQNQASVNQNSIINKNLLNIPKNNGPIAFVDQEMSGFSDGFAYTKIDKPLSHSFFNYKSEDKNTIFTAPEQGKLGASEQSRRIKQIEEKRNTQDQEYTKIMKDQQLQAVLNVEQEQESMQNTYNEKRRHRKDNKEEDMQQMINMQRMQQMQQLQQLQRMQQLGQMNNTHGQSGPRV